MRCAMCAMKLDLGKIFTGESPRGREDFLSSVMIWVEFADDGEAVAYLNQVLNQMNALNSSPDDKQAAIASVVEFAERFNKPEMARLARVYMDSNAPKTDRANWSTAPAPTLECQ